MRKNLLCKIAVLTLIFMFSVTTWAAVWIGAALPDPNAPNNLWSINANWSTGVPPITGEDVYIDQIHPLQPLVDASVAGVGGLARIGGANATQTLTVTGGSLTLSNHCILGQGTSSQGILDISGGDFECGSLWVGTSGIGTLRMTGGTVTTTMAVEKFYVDRFNSASSTVYLYGGVINQAGGIYMGSGGLIDITEGTLLFSVNAEGAVANYINSGQITAYGGATTVLANYDDPAYPGKTWVRTAELYPKAWQPDPEDGTLVDDVNKDLNWKPGYGAVSHDVYFGTTNPPAFVQNQAETSFDPNLLELGQTYYWRIDEYDGSTTHTGDVWSFTVLSAKQARDPNPADGAVGVEVTPVLSWTAGDGATAHDVYFGNSAASLLPISMGQTDPDYTITDVLIKGKTYYWRVDEYDGLETTEGVVWNFTVLQGAGGTNWNNNDPNSELWTSELNWTQGTPGINSDVWLEADPNVLIDETVTAVGKVARVSVTKTDPNEPSIFMTGGTLDLYEVILGQNPDSKPVMEISGGTATITTGLWTGNMDNWNMGTGGRLHVTGGIVNVGTLYVARSAPATGALGVQLDGGVINANYIVMGNGYMDITDGILVLNGDTVTQVKGYIDNGWLTAFGGTVAVSVDYDQTNPGKTTVAACQKTLQTDYNFDCNVNLLDFEVLATEWLSTYGTADLEDLAGEWLR